jgi:hypothetical protein
MPNANSSDDGKGRDRRQGLIPTPKDYGAETKADVGVFLVGASIGGGLDAVLNVAGFAEPFIFAGICGAGALGLKKILDAWRESQRP